MLRIAGNVRRFVAGREPGYSRALTVQHPVFSESSLQEAWADATQATRAAVQQEREVLEDSGFKAAVDARKIPEDLGHRMRTACDALVKADFLWAHHAAMLNANIAVLTGRTPREEALAEAESRMLIPGGATVTDGDKIYEDWKNRLEGAPVKSTFEGSRWDNPWARRARGAGPVVRV